MVPEPSSRDPQRCRRAAAAAAAGDAKPDDPEARRNLASAGGH